MWLEQGWRSERDRTPPRFEPSGKVPPFAAEARKLSMHRRSRSGKDKSPQKRFDIPVLRLSWAHFAAKNVTKSAGFAFGIGEPGQASATAYLMKALQKQGERLEAKVATNALYLPRAKDSSALILTSDCLQACPKGEQSSIDSRQKGTDILLQCVNNHRFNNHDRNEQRKFRNKIDGLR